MNLKIYDEPPAEHVATCAEITAAALAAPKPPRKKHPRCACGCGKAARWPDIDPVFHTRLCGYNMALEIVRGKKEAK